MVAAVGSDFDVELNSEVIVDRSSLQRTAPSFVGRGRRGREHNTRTRTAGWSLVEANTTRGDEFGGITSIRIVAAPRSPESQVKCQVTQLL